VSFNITPDSFEFQLITDQNAFEDLIAQWKSAACLALDTEFIRTNTLLAKPGLVQIADEKGVYLIDPLSVKDLSSLVPILEDPAITKIMHAMSEDVDLLFHSLGARICQVFDTQVAAAFVGAGVSLGYQNLVKQVLEVELDKGETRSDWLQRPLTDSQLRYAALDVIYLIKLFKVLQPKMISLGYLSALFEETRFLTEQSFNAWDHPEMSYLKLRGGWDLSAEAQHLLQELVIWRDKTAVSENIPKPWVFDDASLIEMARRQPKTIFELKRIKSVAGRSSRQFGDAVVAVINQSRTLPTDFKFIDGPLKPDEMTLFRKLKAVVNEVSKQTGIPAQLLGSRKMLEAVVIQCSRHQEGNVCAEGLPAEYLGWRRPFFEQRFMKVLETE
jgi:ribonuclease D